MPICCFVRLRRRPISSTNVPTVCVIYDLQYKTYPEFFAPEDVAHRSRTFIEAARRSTTLAAISDYSRDVAIAEGKLDPASIKTIHLHISQHSLRNAPRDEVDPEPAPARRREST